MNGDGGEISTMKHALDAFRANEWPLKVGRIKPNFHGIHFTVEYVLIGPKLIYICHTNQMFQKPECLDIGVKLVECSM